MTHSRASLVVVRGLTKSFLDEGRGRVDAVAGIDFECREGEIFGLLGANGAGKTTTLRMLSTVLTPNAGTATVMGHDVIEHAAKVRANIGFFSASTSLYPRLSARETLRFFADIHGVGADARDGVARKQAVETRVEALIEEFGIGGYADARVDKLSSGMKQKVSIARTLVHEPPILIFDEPTVGLDIMNAIDMLEVIGSLRDRGKCIIFSTHIMSEVEKLCDRIAIMQSGRILACDGLEGHRERSGKRYLEDIFLHYMEAAELDAAELEAVGARS